MGPKEDSTRENMAPLSSVGITNLGGGNPFKTFFLLFFFFLFPFEQHWIKSLGVGTSARDFPLRSLCLYC